MKATTRNYIGTFIRMATKTINGVEFTSWRTPDNKHYYLAYASVDINIPRFGVNPEYYELNYILLGQLDMVK